MKIIEQANQEALRRMLAGEPTLVDVVPAAQAIPDLKDHMILHAGPPIGWEEMCGPLRGAVMGIAVFEGWAKDLDEAATKAAAGSFAFDSIRFKKANPRTSVAQGLNERLVAAGFGKVAAVGVIRARVPLCG